MTRSVDVREDISSVLSSFGGEFDSYTHLTRSVFDMRIGSVIAGLALQDERHPVLAANALRPSLQNASTTDEGWKVCLDFVNGIKPGIVSSPESYAREQTNVTRNSLRKDEERQSASAMLFYGASSGYETLKAASSYGLLWANERARYQKLDLRNKIVATFACRNSYNIGMNGDYLNEIVHPALVFNSSIDAVLVNHDLQVNTEYEYECLSRSFLVQPSTEHKGILLISESESVGSEIHKLSDMPEGLSDYKEVGEIRFQADGSFTVDSSGNYQRVIRDLLAA